MKRSAIRQKFDQYARDYDSMTVTQEYLGADMVACAVRKYATLAQRQGTLIDLGTGTGKVIENLHGHFNTAIGVDFARKMIDQCAKKQIADNFLLRDLTDTCWDMNLTADIVTAAGVMDFIPSPHPFLKSMTELMHENSLAVVTYERDCSKPRHPKGLAHAFSADIITDAIHHADLSIIEHTSFEGYKFYGNSIQYGLLALRRK